MGDKEQEPEVEIQEKGEIFFFYRPKVQKEEAHNSDDVQRLYIVLSPEEFERDKIKQEISRESSSTSADDVGSKKRKIDGNDSHEETPSIRQRQDASESRKSPAKEVNSEKQMLMRLMIMGRKNLPDPHRKKEKGRPYWGFVDMVTTNIDDLKDALKGEEYDTATRGHRHTSSARAVGEGVYEILKHINPGVKNKKMHTHLVYKLRFPTPLQQEKHEKNEEETPQKSLKIEREASFLIQIKNPSADGGGSFRGLKSERKAKFPDHLEEKFGKLRYCPADPTDFLNYEGCEFLLIAASDDVAEELGVELETEECETPDEAATASCSELLKTFTKDGASASSNSIAPLLKGIWA